MRIRREHYTLHVGDKTIDVDELRSYYPGSKLMPLLRGLAGGPTAEEEAYLLATFWPVEAAWGRLGEQLRAHVAAACAEARKS